VLTRVAATAVSKSSTLDLLVLSVWRQTSWIGLTGPAAKTPVMGNVNVRGVPNWRFLASGVTEKMPPRELTSCIQHDTLPVAPIVAIALATKSPEDPGVIVATTVETPAVRLIVVEWL
jgi:hypothetical protein